MINIEYQQPQDLIENETLDLIAPVNEQEQQSELRYLNSLPECQALAIKIIRK